MARLRRWKAGRLAVFAVVAGGALVAAVPASSIPPNLIVNGSFETPNIPTGTFGIFPSISGWSHTARPLTTSSGIEIQDHVAGAPAVGAGDQFVELDSDGPSIIFQEVATTPGSTYRLAFLYSARPGTPAIENHFTVSAGPEALEIGPLTSGPQTNWVSATLDFVAVASSSRIEFLDLSPEQVSGGFGAYVDEVSVELVNQPPDCSGVVPSETSLSPPNHHLTTVTLSGATDPDGDAVVITITGVTQDEPLTSRGDGTSPDAQSATNSNEVFVRAERNPQADGRVYRIAYTVSDGEGGACSGSGTVRVPRKKGETAVDSGGSFNSFG